MHFFKAFTFIVTVVWCQVEGSHSKSENKSMNHERASSQNKSSLTTELDKTSSTTITTKKPMNYTLSTGTNVSPSTNYRRTLETEESSSETTVKKSDKKQNKIESGKFDLHRKKKLYTRTTYTSELNVTKSVPAIRRHARNRTIRIRHRNGTIITRLKNREGRLLYLRKRGNDTRVVRLRRKRKRRGDNVTVQTRSKHRKLRKHHATSTNEVSEEESLLSNTEHKNDTILLELAKPRKHNLPNSKKPLRDRSVFLHIESLKDTALSETNHKKQRKSHTPSIENVLQDGSPLLDIEHMKIQKHHTISTKKALREGFASSDAERNKKKDATLTAMKQKKHHESSINKDLPFGSALNAIGHVKNLALSATEGSTDTTLSDTQRMHHSSTIKTVLRVESDLSNSENIKDDISFDNDNIYQSTEKSLHPSASSSTSTTKRNKKHTNERKKSLNHHVTSTEKDLRDESDFSESESEDSVEDRSHRWPKRKRKKVGRQGGKHGKPNKHKYDTRTTKCRKTTIADLGDTIKPYTVKAHMNAIKREFQNANITVEVIGRTMSYYDIVMLKVSENKQYDDDEVYFRAHENKYADDGPEKKIVLIVHGLSVMGIHSLPCLMEVKPFKKLLSYYLAHLNKFDIFLIPMANPDGVAVSGTTYRGHSTYREMDWNKNSSPQSECPGVALDRNFDVAWNIKRNLSSCNQQYPGPHPFSELETKAIRDVLHRYSQRIVAYLNVHAGTYSPEIFKGDAVLYPKGYTEVQSDDDKYVDLRGDIEEALKNASFQVYTVNVDTLYNWYGKVGGTSVDYADKEYGIPYAMELVMQLYDYTSKSDEEEEEHNAVLNTSWRRVIGVIFNSVQRYVNATGA